MNTYKCIVHPSTHIHFSSWFVDNVPQHPPTFVFLLCFAIPRTPYHPWDDLILDRTSPEPKKSLPKAQNYQRRLILDILHVLGTSSTRPKKKGWWHPNVYHTQNLNYNNWVDHKSCQPTNSTTMILQACMLSRSILNMDTKGHDDMKLWVLLASTHKIGFTFIHPWPLYNSRMITHHVVQIGYIDATSLNGSFILGIIGFPTFNHFLGFHNSRIAPCRVHSGK